MATETDLCGLGMSPFLAAKLGFQPCTVTGIGTTQSGSPTLLSKNAQVQAATGATAVQTPSSDAGTEFFVFNPGTIASAASALVFVPNGHTLALAQGLTVNGSYTLAVYTSVIMYQAVPKLWYTK
jgi:hypothetical protein